MSQEASPETKLFMALNDADYHRGDRRFWRSIRRVFLTREQRDAEIAQERRTTQATIDLQW